MTQEDKELLLKDLSARLPYGVVLNVDNGKYREDMKIWPYLFDYDSLWDAKPYLRPLSSMTEEENKEYISIWTGSIRGDMIAKIDFYIKHHFDFRLTSEGLSMIEASLALEAPEGMYNLENE